MSQWTEEEKKLAAKLSQEMEIARDVADELVKHGYEERTPASIRGLLFRLRGNPTEEDEITAEETPEVTKERAKIMYFDIESTDLSASFGELMCFGYWWHDEPEPKVLNMWDYPGWDKLHVELRDLYLMQDVVKLIEEADVLVGHFSTGFDHPFIQTRCLVHGIAPVPNPIHIDTWRIAKKQLRLNNNKLKTMAKALGCEQQKSEVPAYIWRRAKAHDVEAMKIISEYNLQDVRTQRDVTERVMPLARNMPNWSLLVDGEQARCPACGGFDLERRGYAYTKLFKYNRLRCRRCGKWMRERYTVTPKEVQRVQH